MKSSKYMLAVTLTGAAVIVCAQPFPSRPVSIIIPYAPGGETDSIARVMAPRLSEEWKRPVVVDNRPGGGTVIGTAEAAKAKPDGHTLLLASFGYVTNQILLPKLSYDPAALMPLTLVSTSPNVLFIHPSIPVTNLKAFVELAKKSPGQLLFGSPGYASSPHISAELLAAKSGFTFTHVPYKGTAPALADLLGGQIHAQMGVMSLMSYAKAGKLRAIAVATERRLSQAPELPTMAESGVPGFTSASWFGYFVQTAAPTDVAHKIYTDLKRTAERLDIRTRLAELGLEPAATTKEEFSAFLRAELDKWGTIIRERNIKLE
jgi:tripartite-type tricarboxylate transporter receptor subunit TctC